MCDDRGMRDSKPFRQFLSSGPAIHGNADPEKYETENSSQDHGRKDGLETIARVHEREFGIHNGTCSLLRLPIAMARSVRSCSPWR